MDFCPNISVSGDYQQDHVLSPPCSKLDDLFPPQNMEVDVSLEWLSLFVEDCFSSKENFLPAEAAATPSVQSTCTATIPKPIKSLQLQRKQQQPHQTPTSLHKTSVPCKARSKRKRATTTPKTKISPLASWTKHLYPHNQTHQLGSSDPPLLQQEYWLADSELIFPKKEEDGDKFKGDTEEKVVEEEKMVMGKEDFGGSLEVGGGQQPRRCSHCQAQRTPQWRAGPLGPKSLCNACGVRYKSGRLLPEYRPAKSPTFVSYLHSNSHKKVLEMRMALLPSIPSQQ